MAEDNEKTEVITNPSRLLAASSESTAVVVKALSPLQEIAASIKEGFSSFGKKLDKQVGATKVGAEQKVEANRASKDAKKNRDAMLKKLSGLYKNSLADRIASKAAAKASKIMRNHWGKLLLLGLFFIPKETWIKIGTYALKLFNVLREIDWTGVFKTLGNAITSIVDFLIPIFEWFGKKLFGEKATEEDYKKQEQLVGGMGTEKSMNKQTDWMGREESDDAWRKRKAEETKKLSDMGSYETNEETGKTEFKGERQGGLFGANRGIMDVIGGLTALGLLLAPKATLFAGFKLFTSTLGIARTALGLIPKLPGLSSAQDLLADSNMTPEQRQMSKDRSSGKGGKGGKGKGLGKGLGKVGKIAGQGVKSLMTMIGPMVVPLVASVAVAFAAYKAGKWLNDKFIKPWVDAGNKEKDAKDAKKWKSKVDGVNTISQIGKDTGAGSMGGFIDKDSLANRMMNSMKGDRNIKRKSGIWGTESDMDYAKRGGGEGLSIEEVKEKYAKEIAAAAKKRGAVDLGKKEVGLAEYSGSEEYKQTREDAGSKDFIADTTGERKEKYTSAMLKIRTDNVDPQKKEVEKLVFNARQSAKGVKTKGKLGVVWRNFGKKLNEGDFDPMWKDRALRALTRKELTLVQRDGSGARRRSKGMEQAKELMKEIRGVDKTKRTREEIAKDKKFIADTDARGAGDAMFEEPIITPPVARFSPQDKTTALKQGTDKMLDGKSSQQSASVNIGGATHNKSVNTAQHTQVLVQDPASATKDPHWDKEYHN